MMIFTFVVGDKTKLVVTTFVTTTYNGKGSANHELISTYAPPYE
jgi:hypothetical protein